MSKNLFFVIDRKFDDFFFLLTKTSGVFADIEVVFVVNIIQLLTYVEVDMECQHPR